MADNPYRGKPMYSGDVCQLMRDINALEAAVSSTAASRLITAADSTHIYVAGNNDITIYKFAVSDGGYVSSFNLPAFSDTYSENISINIEGSTLYILQTARVLAPNTRVVRMNTGGSLIDVLSINSDPVYDSFGSYGVADSSGIYLASYYSNPAIHKFSYEGNLVWRSSPSLGNRFGVPPITILRAEDSIHLVFSNYLYVTDVRYSIATMSKLTGAFIVPGLESSSTGHFGSMLDFVATDSGYYLLHRGVRSGDPLLNVSYYSSAFAYDQDESDGMPIPVGNSPAALCTDYSDYVYAVSLSGGLAYLSSVRTSDNATVLNGVQLSGIGLGGNTEWFAYRYTGKSSLGTPDSGVAIPDLEALTNSENPGTTLAARHITDMRQALQAIAPYYKNALTSNSFNWTYASDDNLYYAAMGDRTDYGATGGAKYDWTHSAAELIGNPCYDLDIGEIYECVEKLKASDPV